VRALTKTLVNLKGILRNAFFVGNCLCVEFGTMVGLNASDLNVQIQNVAVTRLYPVGHK